MAMNGRERLFADRLAVASGVLGMTAEVSEALVSTVGGVRDQGVPEEALEPLAEALAALRGARGSLLRAQRELWKRVEEAR